MDHSLPEMILLILLLTITDILKRYKMNADIDFQNGMENSDIPYLEYRKHLSLNEFEPF